MCRSLMRRWTEIELQVQRNSFRVVLLVDNITGSKPKLYARIP